MIDPPWPFELYSTKGAKKSASAQYRVMTLDDIAALPVRQLIRGAGVVVCWCTWPLVALGIHADMMRAWGIEPKTGGDWAKRYASGKLRIGTGFLIRSVCEPFIIATVGKGHGFRGRSFLNLVESTIDGLPRQHSRKPDEFYSMIEHLTPGARRADIFSREPRPGWDAFGDEMNKYGRR